MPDPSILPDLMRVIADRKAKPQAERSYVASLLAGGTARITPKITEEAAEVVEVADLVFHTLVLLGHLEIPWSAVEAELTRRFGVSGIAEKQSRGQG